MIYKKLIKNIIRYFESHNFISTQNAYLFARNFHLLLNNISSKDWNKFKFKISYL